MQVGNAYNLIVDMTGEKLYVSLYIKTRMEGAEF